MSNDPVYLLKPVFNFLDSLIRDRADRLHVVFVYGCLFVIGWILSTRPRRGPPRQPHRVQDPPIIRQPPVVPPPLPPVIADDGRRSLFNNEIQSSPPPPQTAPGSTGPRRISAHPPGQCFLNKYFDSSPSLLLAFASLCTRAQQTQK